jgi:hypothetical protein
LILALVNCLSDSDCGDVADTGREIPSISVQFEAMLSARPYELLHVMEICDTTGISAQVLKDYSSKVLGMSAHRYQRLRRLKRVRAELLRVDRIPSATIEVLRPTASLISTDLLRSTGTLMAKCRHALPERPSDRLYFQTCRFCIAAPWSILSTYPLRATDRRDSRRQAVDDGPVNRNADGYDSNRLRCSTWGTSK